MRCSIIDVGTNSVLCLVAEGEPGRPFQAVVDMAAITRLGEGLRSTGRLQGEAIARTMVQIAAFVRRSRELGVERVTILATAAARMAANGSELMSAIRQGVYVEPVLVAGEEEGALSFQSAFQTPGVDASRLAVVDIGGGSTEVVWGGRGRIESRRSMPWGVVSLSEAFLAHDPPSQEEMGALRREIARALAELPPPPRLPLVSVGGTVTTLAAVDLGLVVYDPVRVDGHILGQDRIWGLLMRLSAMPLQRREQVTGMQQGRAPVIVAGAALLLALVERFHSGQVTASDRGLRYAVARKIIDGQWLDR